MAFPMEQQQQTDWCWDAVAVSVDHYFDPKSPWTQPKFAAKVLHLPQAEAVQPAADRPFYLSDALAALNLLKDNPQCSLSFSEIQQQLDQNLPVCVHIAWTGGGGSHYVVVTGYSTSPGRTPIVCVSDPWLRDGNIVQWDYEAFVFAYSPKYAPYGEGEWVDTCLVKPIRG